MALSPELLDYISSMEQAYNVPHGLVQSVLMPESGGDPNATSPAGAQGLMQLMPATAKARGVTDPYDPYQSIKGGAAELGDLYKKYQDVPKTLMAYNWGQGNLDKYGPDKAPQETRDYVPRVMNNFQKANPDQMTPNVDYSGAQSPTADSNIPSPPIAPTEKKEGLMGKLLPLVFRFGLPTIAAGVIGSQGGLGALAPMLGTLAAGGMGQLNQNALDKKNAADKELDLQKLGIDYGFKKNAADLAQNKLDFEKDKLSYEKGRNEALDKSLIDYRNKSGKASGKTVSNSIAEKWGDADAAILMLNDRAKNSSKTDKLGGPIMGRIQGMIPWATNTQNFKADLNLSKQLIGKYLEGGVLREHDEKKYTTILPTLADTPKVRAHKWKLLADRILKKRDSEINAFQKLGYNTFDYGNTTSNEPSADSEGNSIESGSSSNQNNLYTTDDGLEYTIE